MPVIEGVSGRVQLSKILWLLSSFTSLQDPPAELLEVMFQKCLLAGSKIGDFSMGSDFFM